MSDCERVFIKGHGAAVAELRVSDFDTADGSVVSDVSLSLQDNGNGIYLNFYSCADDTDTSAVEEALREADTLIDLLEKYKAHIKKIVGEKQ